MTTLSFDSRVINLTQHAFSVEQIDEITQTGDFIETNDEVKSLITFNDIPTGDHLHEVASNVAIYARKTMGSGRTHRYAMIGGAPYFMSYLERALLDIGITPIYAFSKRVSQEDPETGVKTSVFRHEGFVVSNGIY